MALVGDLDGGAQDLATRVGPVMSRAEETQAEAGRAVAGLLAEVRWEASELRAQTEAREQARAVVAEAEAHARALRAQTEEGREQARALVAEARDQAQLLVAEAREQARAVVAEAEAQAGELRAQAEEVRQRAVVRAREPGGTKTWKQRIAVELQERLRS